MAAKQAADYSQVPTYRQVAEEANLPKKVKAEDLVDREIVIEGWEPATAILPDTGKETDGFEVTVFDVATEDNWIFFCGQTILKRELAALTPPFRTVIKKVGRTYQFS